MNEFHDEESKNLSITLNNKIISITRVEDLPNELFSEIFDYLDGYDIHRAFSNLNIRFQNFLTCSSVLFKMNLFSSSDIDIENYFNNIIIPNKHKIISLSLWNSKIVNRFLTFLTVDLCFNRLESLILHRIKSNQLISLLTNLSSLPCFFSLKIHLDDDVQLLDNIYQLIFRLPFLKYNKFSLIRNMSYNILVPSLNNNIEQISTIEYLIINHSCTLNDIFNILYHTPRLCHLSCIRLVKSSKEYNTKLKIILPNLRYISIGSCNILFEDFEIFIKKISFHLKILRIRACEDVTYLDAYRWEQLILQYMPNLCKFYFEYRQFIDNISEFTSHHMRFNQFTSSFWIARQWILEVQACVSLIPSYMLLITIHPCRRIWSDFDDYSDVNQDIDRNMRQQLSIIYLPITTQNVYLVNKINPILSAVQFTCLDITCNIIYPNMIMELIRSLPNLDSLSVSYLSSSQSQCLSVEDANILLCVSNGNNIRKVRVKKINEPDELYFFIDLCPRMECFEIGAVTNDKLEFIIRTILMKKIQLCLLCLNIGKSADNLIQKLQTILNLEKLLDSYSIKPIDDKIYLEWKQK